MISVGLFGQCESHKDCAGSYTECLAGYCVCQEGYHAQDGVCRKYKNKLNLVRIEKQTLAPVVDYISCCVEMLHLITDQIQIILIAP